MGWVVPDLGYGFAHVGVAVGLVGGEDVLEAGGAGVCEFDHALLLCAGNFFWVQSGGGGWCFWRVGKWGLSGCVAGTFLGLLWRGRRGYLWGLFCGGVGGQFVGRFLGVVSGAFLGVVFGG